MHRQKRVLVSWYTHPKYIPPFSLSERQVTVGPKVSSTQILAPYDGFTPFGRFDLPAALEALRLPTEFDAIVVWSDACRSNQPINLAGFDCPKILCVGDTHHMETPLRGMVDYAKDAGFDFILSSHNRQHLHWFSGAGFKNVAWLPGIKVQNLSRPFSNDRKPEVCFFGTAGKLHPRRTHLIAELNRRKAVPFVAMPGTREKSAERFATSAVSLNCSLNGDLNLRIFEILAAGGCLLTDRLSPQSGLALLLEEGKEFIGYDSVEECIEQARSLLAHPEAALRIARAGIETFNARMLPEQRAQQLFEWVFQGKLDSLFCVDDFPPDLSRENAALSDRIRVYEQLQEVNRVTQAATVLFMGDVPEIYARDASDLRQLNVQRRPATDRAQLAATSWHCVVATRDSVVPEFLRYRQLIRTDGGGAARPIG